MTTKNSKRARNSEDAADLPPRKFSKLAASHSGKNEDSDTVPILDLSAWRVEDLVDAEVYYVPDFIASELAGQWYEQLDKLDDWYHPTLKVYGKDVKQSRSIAAYALNTSISAKYSGHNVQMHYEYPPLLRDINTRVSNALGLEFNHIMLNRYACGAEYIGRHRDTKENGVIASLSLGAERTFVMTPNKKQVEKGASVRRWTLATGSLLVMQGNTQATWKHEIPKEPRVKDGRISITFRQLPVPLK